MVGLGQSHWADELQVELVEIAMSHHQRAQAGVVGLGQSHWADGMQVELVEIARSHH